MKERLARFLNSVAGLAKSASPALAVPSGGPGSEVPLAGSIQQFKPASAAGVQSVTLPEIPVGLNNYPPPERWTDWVEYDPKAWPKKVPRHYTLVPTVCFNCESACGLLAYVDKETLETQKFEGNPFHPGSRGRNCAKGPATKNQVYDPERILYPLKRAGRRGEGKWQRTTWEEALNDIA